MSKVIVHIPRQQEQYNELMMFNTNVFLAGTIDMGNSIDWQQYVIDKLSSTDVNPKLTFNIFNPRRSNFNDFSDEEISYQINWELDKFGGMDYNMDYILFNFASGSKSPISLLELGMCLSGIHVSNVIVVCPKDYEKYLNVSLTCSRFGVKLLDTLDEGIAQLIELVEEDFPHVNSF